MIYIVGIVCFIAGMVVGTIVLRLLLRRAIAERPEFADDLRRSFDSRYRAMTAEEEADWLASRPGGKL